MLQDKEQLFIVDAPADITNCTDAIAYTAACCVSTL